MTKMWTPKDPDREFNAREIATLATLQRIVLVYAAIYLVVLLTSIFISAAWILSLALMYLWPMFLFVLCVKIHGIGMSILLTLLGSAPVVGLAILVLVNSQANDILKRGGMKVGWFGARK